MKIKKELICREIAGERFLVPVGKTVYDANGLFVLSGIAGFIWDLLPAAANAQEIINAVLNEYEVDESTAAADVEDFLNKLKEMEII